MRSVKPVLLPLILAALVALADAGVAAEGLRQGTYRELAKVHDLMERGALAEALQRLDALRPRVAKRTYEHALVLQTYAYLYTAMEHPAQALKEARASLALKVLPQQATRGLQLLSAQLRVQEADYAGALDDLRPWLAGEPRPPPQAQALAGVAYAHLGELPAAIKHLEIAVTADQEPQEVHMRQLLAVYLQAGRDRPAVDLLRRLIERNSGRVDDWRQLSALYRRLGDERRALAVLELAQRRGLLRSERDLLTLADYYLFLDAPLEAALLLKSSLATGAVLPTREHWELLADAWARARETDRAVRALAKAAAIEDDPQLHLRRAQLAAQQDDWDTVLQACTEVLRSPRLHRRGEAQLLAGLAYYHRGDTSAAVAAFRRAAQDPVSRGPARQWLSFLGVNSG
jgi:tetratricopeptide (TPR) repeat protein